MNIFYWTNRQLLKQQAPLLLIVSFLIMLPFRRLAEIPIGIMGIGGIILLVTRTSSFKNYQTTLFTLIFLGFWIPIALSLIGAVSPYRTFTVAASFLRLYLAGIFIIYFMSETENQKKLLRIFALILAAWVFDALFQIATGQNILGYVGPEGRINGFFGALRPNLGVHLATLAPLLLIYAHRNWPTSIMIGLLPAITLIVFLTGSRNGWVMLGIAMAVLAIRAICQNPRTGIRMITWAFLLSILSLGGAYFASNPFAAKVNTSLMAFHGDVESFNIASSLRVPIWGTALAMWAHNPIIGVGARGFRYAYKQYAVSDNDPFVIEDNPLGASHPHQLILELGAETGIIGIIGYIFAMGLLIRAWHHADPSHRKQMTPYAISLLAAFFPLNSGYALYSSSWSAVLFWLIAFYCATISPFPPERDKLNSTCFTIPVLPENNCTARGEKH